MLIIDELGYMELDRYGAALLFQVLTEREENNCVTIAANQSFSGSAHTHPELGGFTSPRILDTGYAADSVEKTIVDRLSESAEAE